MTTPTTVPLAVLRPSPNNPRGVLLGIDELARSIHAQGILQPLLVRPLADVAEDTELAAYEVVCGHRRFAAAQRAGLAEVPVVVREMNDEAAELARATENMGRMDMAPLEEAEAVRSLLATGLTIPEIADRLARAPSHISRRLALLGLAPTVKEMLRGGELTVGAALAIARITGDALQEEAARDIAATAERECLGPAGAARLIERRFFLRLATAPFDTSSPFLGPGPCGTCPKRSGAQADLFGVAPDEDSCTDPACFNTKADMGYSAVQRAAAEQGVPELSADKAREVFGNWGAERPVHGSGFVLSTDRHPEDPDGRTWGELFGDEPLPTILARSPRGAPVLLVDEQAAAEILRAEGAKLTAPEDEKERIREVRRARREEAAADARVTAEILASVQTHGLNVAGWQALLHYTLAATEGTEPSRRDALIKIANESIHLFEVQAAIVELILGNQAKARDRKLLLLLEDDTGVERTAPAPEPKPRRARKAAAP